MADLATIEKAIDDLKKSIATPEEVKQLIKAELEGDALKAKFATSEQLTAELKKTSDSMNDLVKQFKNLQKSGFAGLTNQGEYKGLLGSRQHAKAFGCYVLASICGAPKAKAYLEDIGIDKALYETSGTGGITVPEEFASSVIEVIGKYGVYRRNAMNYPMGKKQTTVPKQTGSVTVYCPEEGKEITPSDITFTGVPVRNQAWKALTAISRELDEDSAVAIGELVARTFGRAFARQEDLCGFLGTGTATYFNNIGLRHALRRVHGTVTSIDGLTVQATAGAWSKITMADLLAVVGNLPDEYDDQDAKFYCTKNFYLTVMLAAAIESGMAGVKEELLVTAYTQNPRFLGRPVEFTGVMPKKIEAADHCPLLFGNLQYGAILGDRRDLSIEMSQEIGFKEDMIYIKATERLGMNNHGVGTPAEAGAVVGLWADIA